MGTLVEWEGGREDWRVFAVWENGREGGRIGKCLHFGRMGRREDRRVFVF